MSKKRQWPNGICSGRIEYHPSHNAYGFVLADVMHGIPTIGSVSPTSPPTLRCGNQHVSIHNYPGQTEEIARRLVACWNACEGVSTDELEQHAKRAD